MPNYRRAIVPGGTYFFTVVTHDRRPLLTDPQIREALRAAVAEVCRLSPFTIDAWVLLPDHLHAVWTLPPGDANYSARWSNIKRLTTMALPVARRPLWQSRFWEHQIRNEEDLNRHVEYVYRNPVKHGHARRVCEWPHSTGTCVAGSFRRIGAAAQRTATAILASRRDGFVQVAGDGGRGPPYKSARPGFGGADHCPPFWSGRGGDGGRGPPYGSARPGFGRADHCPPS